MTTQDIVITAGLIVASYILGSVPFSYLVARARGVDLRTVGSGNIGGANVWRSCGFLPFLVAVTGDIAKGTAATLVALHGAKLPPGAVIAVGVAAILGHTFSLFLGFRGGKAVATSGGVLLAIAPALIPLGILAWAAAFAVTRISSVGSLMAAAIELITGTTLYLTGSLPLAYTLFIWAAAGLIIYLHRENIQRLKAGTENRFKRLS